MFIHDIIKIKLSRQGYLPNYPPHLISDAEMCEAFLPYDYDPNNPGGGYRRCMLAKINYFRDTYPNVAESLLSEYKLLVQEIAYHLYLLRNTVEVDHLLPDWVYTYMLGEVLGPESPWKDLHDLFVLLGTDNLYDEFDARCSVACYQESVNWLKKLPSEIREHRPPTMFGEPHVLKSLRIKQLSAVYK